VKAQCLPFSQIPHTTKLFTDFLAYSPSVQPFYPHPPYLRDWIQNQGRAIHYDASRRERITQIIERQNRSWAASSKTFANIERLRSGACAIVTGQQVGLFGGPMFAVYKALSAVKLAAEATAAGVEAVPVFWLATYDHDRAEVNHVSLPSSDGGMQTLTASSHSTPGAPVSAVRLGEEIVPLVEEAARLLGDSEATQILRDCYRPGETLGSAFARFYSHLFADWGVILLDASDPELHRIAKPIYRAAVEQAGVLVEKLTARGEALESAGYHQQVKVTPSSVLLFTLQDGVRTPIHRRTDDEAEFVIQGEAGSENISAEQLVDRIENEAERFSPNVLLRPIVQDYLLPTVAYTGGAAETAYFAQAGVVYETLLGRITPVVPRFSATLIEPKVQRLLEKYELTVPDVFRGPEALKQQLAARSLPEDLQAAFDHAGKTLHNDMAAIQGKLAKLDRTLVDAAETAISKMRHQIERLHVQAARAAAQKGELIRRHADTLSQSIYPNKGLQERTIGGAYFAARYGKEMLQEIYSLVRSDCHDHQIVEL